MDESNIALKALVATLVGTPGHPLAGRIAPSAVPVTCRRCKMCRGAIQGRNRLRPYKEPSVVFNRLDAIDNQGCYLQGKPNDRLSFRAKSRNLACVIEDSSILPRGHPLGMTTLSLIVFSRFCLRSLRGCPLGRTQNDRFISSSPPGNSLALESDSRWERPATRRKPGQSGKSINAECFR